MAQLKPIIVVCTLIAVSFLLISWIPNGFYATEQTGRSVEAPNTYWSAVELERYGDTWNHTMNGTGCTLQLGLYRLTTEVGGHTLRIIYPQANSSYYDRILQIAHCEVWGAPPVEFIWDSHYMTIYHEGAYVGTILTETQLNSYADNLVFEGRCTHLNLDFYFYYNDTTYSDPVSAFDHNELVLLIGIEWDEMATGMSAWDFVASIMFFNLPNTHWMITAIIAVPLWLALLYAAVTIILTILDLLPFT